jgi:hypothetical protein
MLILAAAAIAIPSGLAAQSTTATDQSGSGQTAPTTGQPGPGAADNAQADAMGDTANPMASDTHLDQRSGMSPSPSTAVPAAAMNRTYPPCTRTLRDECRNRGGR